MSARHTHCYADYAARYLPTADGELDSRHVQLLTCSTTRPAFGRSPSAEAGVELQSPNSKTELETGTSMNSFETFKGPQAARTASCSAGYTSPSMGFIQSGKIEENRTPAAMVDANRSHLNRLDSCRICTVSMRKKTKHLMTSEYLSCRALILYGINITKITHQVRI